MIHHNYCNNANVRHFFIFLIMDIGARLIPPIEQQNKHTIHAL